MFIIKTTKAFSKKALSTILDFENQSWFTKRIWYNLNWKKQNMVRIMKFLQEQMQSQTAKDVVAYYKLKDIKESDDKVMLIFNIVLNRLKKYVPDKEQFGVTEYWQSFEEVWKNREGDCEDFAIAIVTLCRLAGVDWRQIRLVTGDVQNGGHCWVRYIPSYYPYNAVYIDGTYWVARSKIESRPFFWDKTTPFMKITPIRRNGQVTGQDITKSKYLSHWWSVNDKGEWGKYKRQA